MSLSFEFFPPSSAGGVDRLIDTATELAGFAPAFASVTYGAGGSGRDRTHDVVTTLNGLLPHRVMPHLTCIGHTRGEIADVLARYQAAGIDQLLALAGDPPADGSAPDGDFRYASDLVDAVRARGGFRVGVAAFPECHPRSSSRREDRRRLAAKLETADFAITQFFFDVDDYIALVDELAELGCTKPVVPGVIPVINTTSIRRFADMNGARVPERLFARIDEAPTDEERLDIAVDHAVRMVERLREADAPGLHFYTLNRAEPTRRILEACGYSKSSPSTCTP